MRMTDTHILYNGCCPICHAEISQYARAAQATGAPLVFEDLHDTALEVWDLSPDQAMRRLHARVPSGEIISGIEAFALIWDHMPRLRWLASVVRAPLIGSLAALAYNHIAAPVLYHLHLRRERLGKITPAP